MDQPKTEEILAMVRAQRDQALDALAVASVQLAATRRELESLQKEMGEKTETPEN